MTKTFPLSLFLHLAILILFLHGRTGVEGVGNGSGNGAGGSNSYKENKTAQNKGGSLNPEETKGQIVEKPIEIMKVTHEVEKVIKKQGTKLVKQKPRKSQDNVCKDSFGGIGILFNPNGTILKVYPGYPAYEAGIRDGDALAASEEIRGPIGTPIQVTVIHDGETYQLTLIRAKICVDLRP